MTRVRRLLGALLLALSGSAVLLGLLYWWLLRHKPGDGQPEAIEIKILPASPAEELAEASRQATPVVEGEPPIEAEEGPLLPEAKAAPDDLRRIEGIGPKIASVLQEAGIRTFAQLGAAEVSQIADILEARDPRLRRLADPGTWPEQARLAAAGDWEALASLQGQLKGGRRVGGDA